jgi:nucleoside 2-deoxyribosyltransferase
VRVYIATSMSNREAALAIASKLRESGHHITSTWHNAPPPPGGEDGLTAAERAEIARVNFAAIDDAQTVVFLDHPKCRGALVEVGYAYSRRWVVGVGSPVGRSLMVEACVSWADSEAGAVAMLEETP